MARRKQAFLVLAVLAFAAAPAHAGGPIMHWYNAKTGAIEGTVIGGTQGPTQFRVLSGNGTISTGWTHMVQMPDTNVILFYNQNTGSGATAFRNANGGYTTLQGFGPGHFNKGWTTLARLGGERVLFYNAETGLAAMVTVDGSGVIRTVHTYEKRPSSSPIYQTAGFTFPAGYWFIVGLKTGALFYNYDTGDAEYGWFGSSGDYAYHRVKLMPKAFSAGWTHIMYLPSLDRIFYYKRETGLAALGKMDAQGNHTTIADFHLRKWYAIVTPTLYSSVLAYNREQGAAWLLDVSEAGIRETPLNPSNVGAGWSLAVYGF